MSKATIKAKQSKYSDSTIRDLLSDIELYDDNIRADEEDHNAFYMKGKAYLSLYKHTQDGIYLEQTFEAYDKAIKITNSKNALYLADRGRLHAEMGNNDLAVLDMSIISKLPNDNKRGIGLVESVYIKNVVRDIAKLDEIKETINRLAKSGEISTDLANALREHTKITARHAVQLDEHGNRLSVHDEEIRVLKVMLEEVKSGRANDQEMIKKLNQKTTIIGDAVEKQQDAIEMINHRLDSLATSLDITKEQMQVMILEMEQNYKLTKEELTDLLPFLDVLKKAIENQQIADRHQLALDDIYSDIYKGSFYDTLRRDLNSTYLAALVVQTEIVQNNKTGTLGSIGNILQTAGNYIPTFGIGVQFLGAILSIVDSDKQAAMVARFVVIANASSEMENIANAIAQGVIGGNFDKAKLDAPSDTISAKLQNYFTNFINAVSDATSGDMNTTNVVSALESVAQNMVINEIEEDVAKILETTSTKASKLTNYMRELIFGKQESSSGRGVKAKSDLETKEEKEQALSLSRAVSDAKQSVDGEKHGHLISSLIISEIFKGKLEIKTGNHPFRKEEVVVNKVIEFIFTYFEQDYSGHSKVCAESVVITDIIVPDDSVVTVTDSKNIENKDCAPQDGVRQEAQKRLEDKIVNRFIINYSVDAQDNRITEVSEATVAISEMVVTAVNEIKILKKRYVALKLQINQKNNELLEDNDNNTNISDRLQLSSMLKALESALSTKIMSVENMVSNTKGLQNQQKEESTALIKQVEFLTSKISTIDINSQQILKIWQSVEEGRIEVDNLGSEVSRHFVRIENLERNWQETQSEWDAKFEALKKQRIEDEAEGKDVINFFNVRDVCGSFIGRAGELESLESYFTTHTRGMQVIGGLGGMGKTQLALEYAEKHREHYSDKIRWIMAETEATIDQSFREFAEDLNINIEKLSLAEVVDKVYKRLNHQDQVVKGLAESEKTLLVFDNVDSYEKIKDYLPNSYSNNKSNKAKSQDQVQHVLITTRNIREWELKATQGGFADNNLNVIRLEPFSDADSIKLINKFVIGGSLDDATLLATTFGNIPLALTQALSFIKINEIDIQTYLEEYRALRQKELKTDHFSIILESDGNHVLDIYTTLSLNVESLSSSPLGHKAIKLLNLCAYLYADKIPEKIFSEIFTGKIEASKVLSILRGYSLISVKQLEDGEKYIYIHRLLQDVLQMKTYEKREEYLKEVGQLVHKAMDYSIEQVKEILTIAKPLISHAEELIGHCRYKTVENNELKALLGALYSDCGLVLSASAEYLRALSSLQESLLIRKEIYGSLHPLVADSLNNIGVISKDLGRHEDALKYYDESLSIWKEVYGSRHPKVAQSLNNIGWVYQTLARHEEALKYHEESLAIRNEIYGSRHPKVADSLNNIGIIYHTLGRHQEVLKYFEECLAIRKEIYGERHPDVATSLNNIGVLYYTLGRYEEALKCHEESFSIRKEIYGGRHPVVAWSLSNIGVVSKYLERHEEALKYYDESLSIWKAVYGSRHHTVAESLNHIGEVYQGLGRKEQALKYYEESLAIRKEIYGIRHPDVAQSLNNIGMVYQGLGRHEEALAFYKEALSIRRDFFDETHLDVQKSLSCVESIEDAFKHENEKYIISVVNHIIYDNPIVNDNKLLSAAFKGGGYIWLNQLIDLGQDQEIADSLIEASNEYGPQHVIKILFASSIAVNNSFISLQNAVDLELNVHNYEEVNLTNLVGEA